MPLITIDHQSQLPAMPYLTVRPVTTSGVSAANVVATIDVPASHHGTLRPERKNSSDEEPARREESSAMAAEATKEGTKTAQSVGPRNTPWFRASAARP